MHNRYQKILIVIFLFSLIFICNAARVANLSAYDPPSSISAPFYKLRGTTYIPLISVCETHGLSWEWDPIGKVIVLRKDELEARLKLDSYRIYVNGKIKNLEKPVLFHNGTVVVPESFSEKTLDKIFRELAIPKIEYPLITEKRYIIDTIVIDPGHGGKDPGAIGKYGLREKDIVLEISKTLKEKLEDNGIKVKLTREGDTFIPLSKRTSIANKVEADFFISIHVNASSAKRIEGFEIYYLSEATDDSARALAAAENASLKYEESSFDRRANQLDIWGLELTENRIESIELASYICKEVSSKLAIRNRGVKSARFYVLKDAIMPAILVEVGFISNMDDAFSLKSPYYRKKLAEALAEGVLSYKTEYEKTKGFTE